MGYIQQVKRVDILEGCNNFFNKWLFLFTVFDDCSFLRIDVFFSDRNSNW